MAGLDNRRKSVNDLSPGPWLAWRTKTKADRAIRFIETYCRPPKGYGYGKTMKLAPFQKQWIHDIFEPGISAAVLQLPRGNGKSTLLAALSIWATFDKSDSGEPQVPIIATTVGQAKRSVYDVALKMIQAEPELANRCVSYTAIGNERVVANTGGVLFPIANDVDGLQGLDPSLAIADEIGFQPLESWNSLLMASGKRVSSLVVGIGTPGLDRDNALWHMRQAYYEGRTPKGFVFQEYSAPEGCDHLDEANWFLANPALAAGYQNIEALRTNLGLTPEGHFRIFNLGQWVEGTDAWLGSDGRKLWESLNDPMPLELGAKTWVGVDVGLKKDSTAVVVGQRRPDGRVQVECKVWFPTNNEVVDVSHVMEYIRELDRKYTLVEVVYDPRLFEFPALQLADEGIPMIEVPQSLERMTPAFSNLYEAIHNKDLLHNGDQKFATQILNGVPTYNERGFTLRKAKSRGKIDACYALAMMYSRISQPQKTKPDLFIGWS